MREIPFLCLANSARESGHCIAGVDLETRKWIRPIGTTSARLRTYDATIAGTVKQISPFEIALLTVGEEFPDVAQPENVSIVDDIRMLRKLPESLKPNTPIYLDDFFYTEPTLFHLSGAKNDRVSRQRLVDEPLTGSLALIVVDNPESFLDDDRRWRMKVPYGPRVHSLRVTDFQFRDREKKSGRWLICVSLGSEFQGLHFGVIAMATPIDEMPQSVLLSKPNKVLSDQILDVGVYESLKQWRYARAKEAGRSAFTIFHNSTLSELATKRPSTNAELLDIFGMGKRRVEEFGKEILEVIREARQG